MSPYLTEERNMAELISQIPEADKPAFASMASKRIEAAYSSRFFVVYQPTGLTVEGSHRSPKVLGTLKVNDFLCNDQDSADFTITDMRTQESMTIGHVPTRLFDYNVFACIPVQFSLRWDARESDRGLQRSLIFPISFYTTNRSSFFSSGVTYIETPNKLRELYKGHDIRLNFS